MPPACTQACLAAVGEAGAQCVAERHFRAALEAAAAEDAHEALLEAAQQCHVDALEGESSSAESS